MGSIVQFERPDGKHCSGYYAEPAKDSKAAGVVVIQEWWGLNDQIKGVANRLADTGYRALVPDLYRGKVAVEAKEAEHLMHGLNFGDAAGQDIRGAAQYLKQSSSRVAVMGYCMGGALTIAAAVHVPEFAAGVCFYGIPPKAFADPAKVRIPLQGHFANKDDWCTPDAVDDLERTLKSAGVRHEIYRYDAAHAFANERSAAYDVACANQAWERMAAFLGAQIA